MKNIIKNFLWNLWEIIAHSISAVWELVTLVIFWPLSWIAIRLSGWKLIGPAPDVPQFVLVLAPHRQGGGDVLRGLFVKTLMGFRFTLTLMKQELFQNPILGAFLRFVGGLPVDRDHSQGGKIRGTSTKELIGLFKRHPYLALVITPEGTRKNVPWKAGFHKVARGANVPIILATFDYQKKRVLLSNSLGLTGNLETDFSIIQSWYRQNSSGHEVLLNKEDFM